jgi:peptidyl-dipeptidase Dcp
VLDADAFEAFVETGDIFNQEVANKYRTEILEKAGEKDAMDLYINFRGKEPGIDPLLKNRGLK